MARGSRYHQCVVAVCVAAACGDAEPAPRTSAPAPSPAPGHVPAPAAGGAREAPAGPLSHGARNAGRAAPSECMDFGASRPAGPPSALFDAGDPRAQGTDVSDAQGDVPWRSLAEGGVEFVYVRAAEGTKIKDRHFARNWDMARKCGIPRGAYHVFEPTQPASEQAAALLGLLGDDSGELPAVLDIEITPEMVAARNERHGTHDVFPRREDMLRDVIVWLDTVEKATGRRPMIYIQIWYWHTYLGKSEDVLKHKLWAAGLAPRAHDGWPWTLWQHGQPAHWDGRLWDRDVFEGTPAELTAMFLRPDR